MTGGDAPTAPDRAVADVEAPEVEAPEAAPTEPTPSEDLVGVAYPAPRPDAPVGELPGHPGGLPGDAQAEPFPPHQDPSPSASTLPAAADSPADGPPEILAPAADAAADAIPTIPLPAIAAPPVDPPSILPLVDVRDLDWGAIRSAVDSPAIRARIRSIVERLEGLMDRAGGPGMLFDADRADASDRAIRVTASVVESPLWIVGDLHGDLLALEAALTAVRQHASHTGGGPPRIVFLGDLFDDEGFGLETLLRIFELVADAPERVCVLAGNHDEALSYGGGRFSSSVAPSDFTDVLNANSAHEWIERAGKLAVRLFAQAPRALFFPDGLLVAHGGFPLSDLHLRLAETGNWNDPACLADFVWTRAHPTARRKMPNRFSRGSQFGHQDFAAFCALSTALGRPVTHMARGHDHIEERFAIYPAYGAHPVLTTVAMSRRLHRERFGPYERVPTIARYIEGALPEVHRLHVPAELVREVYPEPEASEGSQNGSDDASNGELAS